MKLKIIVLSIILLGYVTEVHSQYHKNVTAYLADSLVKEAKTKRVYSEKNFNHDLNVIRNSSRLHKNQFPVNQVHELNQIKCINRENVEMELNEKPLLFWPAVFVVCGGVAILSLVFVGLIGQLFLVLPRALQIVKDKILSLYFHIKIPFGRTYLWVYERESGLGFAYLSRPPNTYTKDAEHVPWFC